ncbi:hypothetical protein BKA64DRAFT_127905 [Cadophora sp. MPI-SDFR-AT-0126]|nr:hypothetical protein BKA64DRAFT_127905 [Leotiomycetes sp. MPI-SDFR-AT-0126]
MLHLCILCVSSSVCLALSLCNWSRRRCWPSMLSRQNEATRLEFSSSIEIGRIRMQVAADPCNDCRSKYKTNSSHLQEKVRCKETSTNNIQNQTKRICNFRFLKQKSKAVIRWVCHPHQPNEGLPTQRNARIRSPLGHPHEPTFFSPSDGESAQVIACADCPSSQSLMFHFLPAFHARPEIFPLGQYEFLLSSMLCLVSATDSV